MKNKILQLEKQYNKKKADLFIFLIKKKTHKTLFYLFECKPY